MLNVSEEHGTHLQEIEDSIIVICKADYYHHSHEEGAELMLRNQNMLFQATIIRNEEWLGR